MMLTQLCSSNPAAVSEATATRTIGPIGSKNFALFCLPEQSER